MSANSSDVQFDPTALAANREPDGLAALLPRWHLLRDAEEGEPLRALLAVIAEQLDRVRDGVEQGYEDLFVETAAPWVLPYLGDLVGYRTLPGYERVLTAGLHEGGRAALAEAVAPRADVAATVAGRRRKGTLHLLEEISGQVAGWPARAVELSRLVAHHQSVKLYRDAAAERGRLLDLRDGSALALAAWPLRQHGPHRRRPPRRLVQDAGWLDPGGCRPLRLAAQGVLADVLSGVLHRPRPQPLHFLDPRP